MSQPESSVSSKQPPVGARSVRENLAWIRDRGRYALEHDQEVRETLAGVVERAELAYSALDRAVEGLDDWSAMSGLAPGP